jgi:hypothetical protein
MLIVVPPSERLGSNLDRPNPPNNPRKTCFVRIPRSVVHRTSQKPLLFQAFFGRPAAAALNFALLRVAASVPSDDQTTRRPDDQTPDTRHQTPDTRHQTPDDQALNHQTPNRKFCAPAHVSIPSANNSASVQPMPKSQPQSSQRLSAIRRHHNAPTFCALSTLMRKANPALPCAFLPKPRTHSPAAICVHQRVRCERRWFSVG